jgi:TolB protein
VPAPRGVLAVLDLRSGVQAVVSPDEVLGFEWSPDGSRLLFLTASGDDRPQRMRWNVWSGTEITPFEPFVPTALYVRDYLPFFDQYARSQTAWAPDGNAFAYAGTSEDGRSGIWVQRLGSASPAYLGPGEMVSWGP